MRRRIAKIGNDNCKVIAINCRIEERLPQSHCPIIRVNQRANAVRSVLGVKFARYFI